MLYFICGCLDDFLYVNSNAKFILLSTNFLLKIASRVCKFDRNNKLGWVWLIA